MTDAEMPPDPFGPNPVRPLVVRDGAVQVDVEAIPLNIDCPDLAEWCATCALPSALGFRFRVLANGQPLRTEVHLMVCPECGTVERRSD